MRRPFPVRQGDGGGADIATQAKQYSTRALQNIGALLEDNDADPRLRFAACKWILELAWGRPRPMREPAAETEPMVLTGEIETLLLNHVKDRIHGHDRAPDRGDEAPDDRAAGAVGMEGHRAGNATDAAG